MIILSQEIGKIYHLIEQHPHIFPRVIPKENWRKIENQFKGSC